MTEFQPPPEAIADYVSACLEYVRRALNVELDFTPETLPLLDHYGTLARETIRERPELEPLITRAAGAYFGEVVRARLGGFWRVPTINVHDWAICSNVVFLWFNPIGIAYDAVFSGTEHDGPRSQLRVAPEDHEFLAQRLASLPPLPEDEYFSFSTRFETIEVAIEALHARLVEGGYGDSEFSEADYEAGGRGLN
ncbi:MAG TPA: hypothetical protein VHV51_04555 [Polyangiaceae bacterium]|jgi:hypothetical protein|nr:hypothetical protein [Polyangiaceae bacterium]